MRFVASEKPHARAAAPAPDRLWTTFTPDADDWQMKAFVNHLLLRVIRLDAASSRAAKITERQHKALLFIKGAPSRDPEGWVPLQILRACLLADNAAAAQLIGRLARKHLVETKRPTRNGPLFVRLSTSGESVLADIAERNQRALGDLARDFGPENAPALIGWVIRYLSAEGSAPPLPKRT